MIFSIDTENNVTVLDAPPAGNAPADGTLVFSNSKSLTQAALTWPMARFVDLWNKLAPRVGVKPVQKFENRQIAIVRIWKAIERLESAGQSAVGVAEPAVVAALAGPKQQKQLPEGTGAERAKASGKRKTPREGTTKANVIAMLGRAGGATLEEIMQATGWQKHTIRGFISTLGRKTGLKIDSSRREDGTRVYATSK